MYDLFIIGKGFFSDVNLIWLFGKLCGILDCFVLCYNKIYM